MQLSEKDTPDTVAKKIHTLEYEYFPKVIEELIISENKTTFDTSEKEDL